MRDLLENAGYEVIEAKDGAEALKAIAGDNVDVLLLDLKMPVCDGYDVLRALVGRRPPVIVLSAFEQQHSTANAGDELASRVFARLRKPVFPALLLDTVRDALEGNPPA